jgi:hypothetical protein
MGYPVDRSFCEWVIQVNSGCVEPGASASGPAVARVGSAGSGRSPGHRRSNCLPDRSSRACPTHRLRERQVRTLCLRPGRRLRCSPGWEGQHDLGDPGYEQDGQRKKAARPQPRPASGGNVCVHPEPPVGASTRPSMLKHPASKWTPHRVCCEKTSKSPPKARSTQP